MDIKRVIEHAVRLDQCWGFYEEAKDAEAASLTTVSGAIVTHMQDNGASEKSVGLFAAYAAKRSLVCWFKYCRDAAPLSAINTIIDYWFAEPVGSSLIDSNLLTPVVPMENGREIRDCRRSDTGSSSSAVANSACYAHRRSTICAITALSHAHIAFECSPVGSCYRFEDWLISIAFPRAFEHRRLTPTELWAMADFEVPAQLQREQF